MDDLAVLPDITGPEVLETLMRRFEKEQYFTYLGDFLLAFNPCQASRENDAELGQWFRHRKPLHELPPHVLAIAHRAYRMLQHDVIPQAIVITGRSGSGKTKAAKRIVSQFLREARLSPQSGLGPRIIMAQHVLTTMISAQTPTNPDTSLGIKMATFYFRPDGNMVSAELQALCMSSWHLVDREAGNGTFSIFYALLAGLSQVDLQLYYLVDKYRLLSRNDASPVFFNQADHTRHLQMYDFFMAAVSNLAIDEKTRNYAGREMSAIEAVLAAILHFSNVEFTAHAQSPQPVITNHHELRAVCDLLSIRQDQLEGELLTTTTFARGQAVRMPNTAEQSKWSKDVLLVQLYRRLVTVLVTRLNQALSPSNQGLYSDPDPLTPVTVIESSALEDDVKHGRLETFFTNMAAERIQHHLYDVIFARDVEACERERVQAYKIKYPENTELIGAVFTPEHGIMTKLTTVTLDPLGSPTALVSLMENDRKLKKSGCYLSAEKSVKNAEHFSLKHSSMRQVTYSARDFVHKNRAALPETVRQMLLYSGNPLVRALASASQDDRSQRPDQTPPDLHFASCSFQSDLTYLLQTLDNSKLHYIRCVKPNSQMTPGQFDRAVVTDQLKECCVVETTRQRKFGFAACIPQHQFVQRFRELAFSGSLSVSSVTEACKAILKKTELFDKGVTLSKTSVFLRYWHVNRLHALKADHLRRVVVAQSHVRGFLTRRRLRGRITSSQQRALIGQFMHDVSRAGDRASNSVHDQADFDRRRFERELQGAGSRLHHPGSSYQREESEEYASHVVYDSHYGRRDSGEYQLPGYMNDRDSPLILDDTARFYKQVVDKVVSTLHTLEPSVWVKLIYMEKGRQVAKVYAEDKSIMIDGSHVDFDGERLGLGAWRNPDRDEKTAYYRASVMEGVRLKRDQDGSISACRLCDQPIIVKGLEDPDGAGCFSADVLLCRGQLPYERTIKIFDIKEFRSKVALDIKQGRFSKSRMQRACVLGLSFGRDDPDDLETPCWLCVVNVKALAALDSDEIIREAEHETVKLEMTSPEEEIQKLVTDDVKSRHTRGRWARTDQRDHLKEKDKGDRQIRLQLRAKGLPVGEHVRYSWQHEKGGRGDKPTMEALHEMVDPGLHAERSRGSGRVRDWAKVEVAVKDQKTRNMYDRSFSTTSTDDGRN